MTRFKFSRRIGSGGMADVFLGLQEGLGGFEKLVVVKRIFPHLCRDQTFVRMFLDEARVAAAIRHPNVVEILDIKRDDEGFFIVMEYLSGETVEWLGDTLFDAGVLMPWPIALAVGADIAQGLDSAHTATDENGRPRRIVHRDITPSNLLVCYSGGSKILDFGIAKFEASDEQEGTLAGKPGYMAPEQLDGGVVDARTDVFQLGVVLYEMLTGVRAYGDAIDVASMRELLARPVAPPSAHRPELPAAVDDLLAACMAIDPNERCESAAALCEGIRRVTSDAGHPIGPFAVGEWMSDAFAERRAERESLERAALREMRQAGTGDLPTMFDPVRAGTADTQLARGSGARPAGARRLATIPTLKDRPGAPTPARRRRTRWVRSWRGAALAAMLVAAAVVLLALPRDRAGATTEAGGAGVTGAAAVATTGAFGPDASAGEAARDDAARDANDAAPGGARGGDGRDGASPSASASASPSPSAPATATAPGGNRTGAGPGAAAATFTVNVAVRPRSARVYLDDVLVGTGRYRAVLARDGATHRLRVAARGYEDRVIAFRDTPPARRVRLRRHRRARPAPDRERPARSRARTDNRDPWAR